MSPITSGLLVLLPLVSVASAQLQSPGSWTINASAPVTNLATSGCVILAQLTLSSTLPIIQAMLPICPSNGGSPTLGLTVRWPIAANADEGQGVASSMAIYGNVVHTQSQTSPYDAQAGCEMLLSADQVQYLLGRTLTWNNDLEELYDDTASGFVMNGTDGPALTCGHDEALLPTNLRLPNPYFLATDDVSWQVPITLDPVAEVIGTSTLGALTSTSSSLFPTATHSPSSSSSSSSSSISSISSSDVNDGSPSTTSTTTSINVPDSSNVPPSGSSDITGTISTSTSTSTSTVSTTSTSIVADSTSTSTSTLSPTGTGIVIASGSTSTSTASPTSTSTVTTSTSTDTATASSTSTTTTGTSTASTTSTSTTSLTIAGGTTTTSVTIDSATPILGGGIGITATFPTASGLVAPNATNTSSTSSTSSSSSSSTLLGMPPTFVPPTGIAVTGSPSLSTTSTIGAVNIGIPPSMNSTALPAGGDATTTTGLTGDVLGGSPSAPPVGPTTTRSEPRGGACDCTPITVTKIEVTTVTAGSRRREAHGRR